MTVMTTKALLPISTQDLLSMRKKMQERTLNDHVDDIHVALWENPAYHTALEAVDDADAVEGSLAADNFLASTMIRDHARETANHHIKDKKLATIVKALNVVLRRYGIDRKTRAATIDGVLVPTSGE